MPPSAITPPSGDLYFDVMTRLGNAASYDTVEAETKDIEGIRVHVATPQHSGTASIRGMTMNRDRRVQKFRSG